MKISSQRKIHFSFGFGSEPISVNVWSFFFSLLQPTKGSAAVDLTHDYTIFIAWNSSSSSFPSNIGSLFNVKKAKIINQIPPNTNNFFYAVESFEGFFFSFLTDFWSLPKKMCKKTSNKFHLRSFLWISCFWPHALKTFIFIWFRKSSRFYRIKKETKLIQWL